MKSRSIWKVRVPSGIGEVVSPRGATYSTTCQLIDKQNFDQGRARRPLPKNGAALVEENAARIASAMQFFRGLCDHASLIARARQLVVARLAAAVAAGDCGHAVGRAAGD